MRKNGTAVCGPTHNMDGRRDLRVVTGWMVRMGDARVRGIMKRRVTSSCGLNHPEVKVLQWGEF